MSHIGHKTEGLAEGRYPFVEFQIKGIKKTDKRIVVQQNREQVWYIYDVTPGAVVSIGFSYNKDRAIRKAREYIKRYNWEAYQ